MQVIRRSFAFSVLLLLRGAKSPGSEKSPALAGRRVEISIAIEVLYLLVWFNNDSCANIHKLFIQPLGGTRQDPDTSMTRIVIRHFISCVN